MIIPKPNLGKCTLDIVGLINVGDIEPGMCVAWPAQDIGFTRMTLLRQAVSSVDGGGCDRNSQTDLVGFALNNENARAVVELCSKESTDKEKERVVNWLMSVPTFTVGQVLTKYITEKEVAILRFSARVWKYGHIRNKVLVINAKPKEKKKQNGDS